MERKLCYGFEKKMSGNQKCKEIKLKLFDIILLKLISGKTNGKSCIKSCFRSLRKQIVKDPPLVCHVESQNLFAKVI